jgi:peptide-methionine (S)-S-oxide reductase
MNVKSAFVIALVTLLGLVFLPGCQDSQEVVTMDNSESSSDRAATEHPQPDVLQEATFAAGCFWGVEASFRQLEGVVETSVGYAGGDYENPTYEVVCSGRTGHAEAVRVVFDPSAISYEELLDAFWTAHDPTTLNRQGPDIGSQYRSAIFFHDADQQSAAKASLDKLEASGAFGGRRIVTQVGPAKEYYRAEEYHQRYLEKQGRTSCSSTCR